MSSKNFEFRMKSFKKGAHHVEWPHKHLSKVGMSRSFYYYQPTTSDGDRVLCSNCDAVFQEWGGYSGYPIQRHAGVNSDCFVAKLGELSRALTNGELTLQSIENACLSSFNGIECSEPQVLALQGFNCVPNILENTISVGCVACLCYPQIVTRRPKHAPHCILAASISKLLASEQIEANENGKISADSAGLEATGLEIKDKAFEATVEKLDTTGVINHETVGTSKLRPTKAKVLALGVRDCSERDSVLNPTETCSLKVSPYKNLLISSDGALEHCTTTFNDGIANILVGIASKFIRESEVITKRAIDCLEFTIMEGLKYAHYENINAVNRETDRIVSSILRDVHSDFIKLNTN